MSNVDVDARLSLDGKGFITEKDRVVNGVREIRQEAQQAAGAMTQLTLSKNNFIASMERELLNTGKSAEQRRLLSIATADLNGQERDYAQRLARSISDKERSIEATDALRTGMMAAGSAIGAGTVALGMLTFHEINAADQMLALSQRTGVATEALSKWTYAGEQFDLTADNIGQGLRRLNLSLVEARDGSGRAAEAFKALRLDPNQFASLEEALPAIARRFAAIESGADKAAIAAAIFGKETGDKLIPMLNAGEDGLRQMGDEAERFGRVISGKMAAQADAFNDNLTRMKSAVQGVGHAIAAELLPDLVRMSEEMLEGHRIAGGFIESMRLFGTINPFREVQENLELLSQDLANKKQWRINIGADLPMAATLDKEIADLEKQVQFLAFQRRKQYEENADKVLAQYAGQGITDPRDNLATRKEKANFDPDGPGRKKRGRKEADVNMRGENFAGVKNDFSYWESLAEQSRTWQENIEADEKKYQSQLLEVRQEAFDQNFIALSEAYLREQQTIQELRDADRLSDEEYQAAKANAAMRYMAAQGDHEAKTRLWLKDFALKTEREKVTGTLQLTQSLTNGLALYSRAAFNVNKAARIAETSITTYNAAVNAFNAMAGIPYVGPVLGAIAAANAIAFGMAQVKQIKSAEFGGGGGGAPAVPSMPSMTTSPPPQSAPQQDSHLGGGDGALPVKGKAAEVRQVNVVFRNEGTITSQQVREVLIPLINEAIGDGVELRVTTN